MNPGISFFMWVAMLLLTSSTSAEPNVIESNDASPDMIHIKAHISKENLKNIDFLKAILADYEVLNQSRQKNPNIKGEPIIISIDVEKNN